MTEISREQVYDKYRYHYVILTIKWCEYFLIKLYIYEHLHHKTKNGRGVLGVFINTITITNSRQIIIYRNCLFITMNAKKK
jgi:hypothetical protein